LKLKFYIFNIKKSYNENVIKTFLNFNGNTCLYLVYNYLRPLWSLQLLHKVVVMFLLVVKYQNMKYQNMKFHQL